MTGLWKQHLPVHLDAVSDAKRSPSSTQKAVAILDLEVLSVAQLPQSVAEAVFMRKTDKGLQRRLNHPGGIPLGLPEKWREVAQLTREDELESSEQHGLCPLRQSDWQESRMYLIRACCCSPAMADSVKSVSLSPFRTQPRNPEA